VTLACLKETSIEARVRCRHSLDLPRPSLRSPQVIPAPQSHGQAAAVVQELPFPSFHPFPEARAVTPPVVEYPAAMWGLEKLLNMVLDLAVPVMGTLLLLFWAPVLGAASVVRRTWNWLRAPTMRGKVVLISGASSGIGEVRAWQGWKQCPPLCCPLSPLPAPCVLPEAEFAS